MCCGTGWEWEARLLVQLSAKLPGNVLEIETRDPSISGGFIKSVELKVKNY